MAFGQPALGRLKAWAVAFLRPLAATMLTRRSTRRALNAVVLALPWSGQTLAYRFMGRSLYGRSADAIAPGEWRVDAYGCDLRIPLKGDDVALRYEIALSLLGHDPEVKRLYDRLLRSDTPPRTFYDVGANFGTHSLAFLAHGVRTLSFEPNPECHPLFLELCRSNGLLPELHQVAVGAEAGVVTLSYPSDATWLGTTSDASSAGGPPEGALRTVRVPQRCLDDMVDAGAPLPDVLKIDTEGNELDVLRGAARMLAKSRPLLIFEALPDGPRTELFDQLDALGYQISAAPGGPALSRDRFVLSRQTNFVGENSRSHEGSRV